MSGIPLSASAQIPFFLSSSSSFTNFNAFRTSSWLCSGKFNYSRTKRMKTSCIFCCCLPFDHKHKEHGIALNDLQLPCDISLYFKHRLFQRTCAVFMKSLCRKVKEPDCRRSLPFPASEKENVVRFQRIQCHAHMTSAPFHVALLIMSRVLLILVASWYQHDGLGLLWANPNSSSLDIRAVFMLSSPSRAELYLPKSTDRSESM